MTNLQFYFAIGVPFFTILVVWIGSTVANRHAIQDLRAEIHALGASLRAEMKAGFEAVDKRLTRLKTTVDRIDSEIRQNHEHRLTILEERVLGRVS